MRIAVIGAGKWGQAILFSTLLYAISICFVII